MSIFTVLLVILILIVILILFAVLPTWPHSRAWGYGPSGVLGTMVMFLLALVLWDGL